MVSWCLRCLWWSIVPIVSMVPMVSIVSMVPMVSMVPICLWSYVKELLGDNHHLYEAFISHTDIDYSTEAQTFLNPFYVIALGNTMPLPLSTALQFSIVIFSKDSRTPIMYVTPDNVASEATTFVYNPQEGEGHYDVALPYHRCSNVSSLTTKLSVTFCKCGINKRGLDILRS